MASKEEKAANEMLQRLVDELNKDPSGGISLFVDMLASERLHSRAIMSKFLGVSLGFGAVMLALVVYLAEPRLETKVVQQRLDGSLAEVAVTDKPYYELQDVKDFAQRRATQLHNWSYSNYIQHFEDERQFWDEEPINTYVDTLIDTGVFSSAEQYRRRFEAVVPKSPKIYQQYKYNGDYRVYRVELLLIDESTDIEGVDQKAWKIRLDVRETTPEEGWAGLKVVRYDETLERR